VNRRQPDAADQTAITGPEGQDDPDHELLKVAEQLNYMIGQITPDEFAWQDANYDRNSILGRELLFLIANDSWIRATSEIIDIARSDAIETTIEVDIDLSLITHEAFRDRTGQIWLPIAVLPPLRPLRRRLRDPEPFSTLTVTDASGAPLMTLPRSDIRHRLAAALAAIIVNVAAARLPDVSSESFSPGRYHRLVLAAAIYRLLRAEIVPALAPDRPDESPGPIGTAADEVRAMVTAFAALLKEPVPRDQANRLNARQLTERAVRVLEAVTKSAIIVIPVNLQQPPTVLKVTLPGRALHLAPVKWSEVFGEDGAEELQWSRVTSWRRFLRFSNWIFPNASVHLDLLLPSASADRHVRVNLPDGISPDPVREPDRRADLEVRSVQPQSISQLATVTGRLLDADPSWPAPLHQSLADLALAKANAAEVTLRDHHIGAEIRQPPLEPRQATLATRAFRTRLQALRSVLRQIAMNGNQDITRDALARAWDDGRWLDWPMQRRTSTDTISPGVVAARVRAIEDVTQRSATRSAKMEVRVAVTDSAYYTAAQLSGLINILLMSVVLGFFGLGHLSHSFLLRERLASPEVLALALTLFSAIQLGRIERNDRSVMRGVLVPAGNPLIVLAILPTVGLAVAFAFSRSFAWSEGWTAACMILQATQLLLTRYWQGKLLDRGKPAPQDAAELPADDLGPEPDLLFYTDEPDYAYDLVLHSDWWQTTTAEALIMDRDAYGYIVWQHDDQRTLDALLADARPRQSAPGPESTAPAANVLALQRSGTYGQMLNFAVFRDEPDDRSGRSDQAVGIKLDPSILTLGVDATFAVFLGLPWHHYSRVGDHPVTSVLRLATARGLATCDTRLPVPAPDVAYADLSWSRIELSARPEDLDHIPLFLADLLMLTEAATVGVRTRRDGVPRILNPRSRPRSKTAESADLSVLARANDLDTVSRSDVSRANPDDRNWRVMAICDDWRIGIEARALAGINPEHALIAISSTVLYGQSVLLLLCHSATGPGGEDAPELRPLIRFDEWQSRAELGIAPPHPLLRVTLRTPDRPGATIGVLEALRDAIQHKFEHALANGDLSVWYARAEVEDGNTAHVQFTVMLPIPAGHDPAPAHLWNAGDLWQIERRALEYLAARIADGNGTAAVPMATAKMPPETTIQLGLIKMPDLARRPSATPAPAAEADGPFATESLQEILAASRSSRPESRTAFRVLATLALVFLASTIAITAGLVSGASFLPVDPSQVADCVTAAATVVCAWVAVVQAQAARRSASRRKPAAPAKRANMQARVITREEYALVKAHRRQQRARRGRFRGVVPPGQHRGKSL
jgi:hypothetical protein